MEDNMNFNEMPDMTVPMFAFDAPRDQSSYIKVIGVGGGGGNAVNHMYREGITGVDFIVCNTDMKALNASPVPNKIPLGNLGLGAGGKPEKARKAALAKADEIREVLSHNTQMLFITAGMGGGTGTGAAPVIAEIAKSIDLPDEENKKILVVAIVTRPFSFEGSSRSKQAEAGIEELRKQVDSIIIINNDKLFGFGDLTMSKAYALADDVLLTAAKGIAEIISKEGYVCRDFQDINSVMEHSGRALMGTGSGSGEDRAKKAIDAATTSVLLDDSDIFGAKNVLLYFTSSHEHEMTIREQMEITDIVCQATGGAADVKYGAGYDDDLGDELKVTLIATGFDKSKKIDGEQPGETIVLDVDKTKEETPFSPVNQTSDADNMVLVRNGLNGVVDTNKPVVEETKPVVPADVDVEKKVEKTIIPLYSVEDEAKPVDTKETVVDEAENGIYIKQQAPAPIPAPAPAPTPAPEPAPAPVDETPIHDTVPISRFDTLQGVRSSEERIRLIHDMLHNDPNGPERVSRMSISEMMTDSYELPHSSRREASSYTVDALGRMVSKPTLKDGLD